MTLCSVKWSQPTEKCVWCIHAALLLWVCSIQPLTSLFNAVDDSLCPQTVLHPFLPHTWLQQCICFTEGQLINLQRFVPLCSEAPGATIFLASCRGCCCSLLAPAVVACSGAVSWARLLLAPKSIPVGVRRAQQGCAERAVLALEQGPCRGLQQEGKFPISYRAPPSHLYHSAHLLKEDLWSLCRPQSFSLLLPHPAPPFHLVFVFPCCLLFAPFESWERESCTGCFDKWMLCAAAWGGAQNFRFCSCTLAGLCAAAQAETFAQRDPHSHGISLHGGGLAIWWQGEGPGLSFLCWQSGMRWGWLCSFAIPSWFVHPAGREWHKQNYSDTETVVPELLMAVGSRSSLLFMPVVTFY